jgi:hypothetical protein
VNACCQSSLVSIMMIEEGFDGVRRAVARCEVMANASDEKSEVSDVDRDRQYSSTLTCWYPSEEKIN